MKLGYALNVEYITYTTLYLSTDVAADAYTHLNIR